MANNAATEASPIVDFTGGTEEISSRSCKDIFVDGIKGGSIYVSLTVIALAIVFSMMTVNWTKMIYNEDESKLMVYVVLICSIGVGNMCIFLILLCVVCCTESQVKSFLPDSPYEAFKLGAALIFAACNLAHCGFYIDKHANGSSGCSFGTEGIIYNVFSITYTVMLMCGIFAFKVKENTVLNKFLSAGILFANFSFWLDTIFSESGELFQNNSSKRMQSPIIGNKTRMNSSCYYTESSLNVIETFDPLFSPGTVEFAIITVDLLFYYGNKEERRGEAEGIQDRADTINAQPDASSNNNRRNMGKITLIILFGIFSFALFVTSIVGYAEKSKDGSKEDNTDTLSPVYKAYICTSLIVKIFMFLCLTGCICFSFGSFKYTYGIEGLILIVSCFGNVVYHMFYLFAVRGSYKNTQDGTVHSYLVVSYLENILSIILAWEHTMFILATQTGEKLRKNKYKNIIYFACLLLTIMNFGLWVSDSFGEAKVAALGVIIKKNYSNSFWVIFTKLVLPITIFFRLHSGLIFLKMFCDRNASAEGYVELEPRCRGGHGINEEEGGNTYSLRNVLSYLQSYFPSIFNRSR